MESRGALYVYKDLSTSLELHVIQKLERPEVETWSLSALLDVEPADTAGTTGTANTATLTISALVKRGLSVHGLPESEPERELPTNESIAFFDELFSPPQAGSISFTLTGFYNATVYDFKGNVRAPREDLSRALILTSIFTDIWWRYAHATRFELDPWELLGVFTIAFQGVEVRSGGELHVSVEEVKNVIPTTTLFKLDLKTPRIVKRGLRRPPRL